jgi:prolyl-tRNA synthetase
MVHGDDSGLVLPPRIAPTQVMIVPIMQKKEGVLEKAAELKEMLSKYRVKVDSSDKNPGFKFAEQEMRGIPLRVEVGPKDIEAGQAIVVRRDTREKVTVPFENLDTKIGEILEQMQKDMYDRALAHREANTHTAANWDEFTDIINTKQGFIKAMWCGSEECETAIKDETGASTRCMPFAQEHIADTCVYCGKPAKKMVYFGRAY